MKKYFCDKCGKEIDEYSRKFIMYKAKYDEQQKEYCNSCFADIMQFAETWVDMSEHNKDPRL